MKKSIGLLAVIVSAITLGGCEFPWTPAANIASKNLSNAADNFEVLRRIRVFNGISGEVVMEIRGFCSLQDSLSHRRDAYVCKNSDDSFVKHFLDRGDNTFVLSEQVSGVDVSTFHTRVFVRPQSFIPDLDFQGDADELNNSSNTDG